METFDFNHGRIISRKYKVISKLGAGFEGEVYLIEEIETGIGRAAKFFYPQRNLKGKTSIRYAKKLHKLRHCDMIIQYHHQEKIKFDGQEIHCLVSDFVEGDLLSNIISKKRGKRIPIYEAFHIFYKLVCGVEHVHTVGEYHGDLHSDNIFVKKYGTGFDIKLIDLYHHNDSKSGNMQFDILNLIKILYEMLGGQKHYGNLPKGIKNIISGQKSTLIQKKFRNISKLRQALENFEWDD